jgi:hypothetical protein
VCSIDNVTTPSLSGEIVFPVLILIPVTVPFGNTVSSGRACTSCALRFLIFVSNSLRQVLTDLPLFNISDAEYVGLDDCLAQDGTVGSVSCFRYPTSLVSSDNLVGTLVVIFYSKSLTFPCNSVISLADGIVGLFLI